MVNYGQSKKLANLKNYFILKDGCISIVRDKFLSSIDLSLRTAPILVNRRSFNTNENSTNQNSEPNTSLSTSPTSTDADFNSFNQSFNSSSSSITKKNTNTVIMMC